MSTLYHNAAFLTSAAQLSQLPADQGVEVAFAGRSNAGKSSVLNALTQQKNLARVSKTPGRTQLINLFCLDDHRRLVDLPGYGYAEVPEAVKERWQKTLSQYLQERQCLKGLILVTDIRHPLKSLDQQMLSWCQAAELPCHILLNKADKLSKQQQIKTLQQVQQVLKNYSTPFTVQLFSAQTHQGAAELNALMNKLCS